MALQAAVNSPFDRQPYVVAARAGGWSAGPSDSIWRPQVGGGGGGPARVAQSFYYARLDRFYAIDGSASATNNYLYWDPLMIDATSPAAGYVILGSGRKTILCVGEWDKAANVQKIYGAVNSGNNSLNELDSTGSAPSLTDLGTFPHHASIDTLASTGISATIGERDQGHGIILFFETAGFALQPDVRVRHTDNVQYDRVMARIDLTTGLSTIETAIPVGYQSSPHAFQLPPAQGREFTFDYAQFVPDEDSLPALPKGILHLCTTNSADNLRDGPVPGVTKCYIKQVEFNPFGVSPSPGNPNRVHGREVLFSRFDLIEETPVGSGGIGVAPSTANAIHEGAAYFHPPSNTIKIFYNFDALSMDGDNTEVRFTTVPAFSQLSAPTARNEVETNKTATFQVEASGDIGEPIPNFDIAWTLDRVSTFEEALDTVGLPATSTVDNPPIDSDDDLVVKRDSTVLILNDDYSVVPATGVITWLNGTNGNHPTQESGYTATYRHTATEAAPPHGTLLNNLSKTDEDGLALARVSYPDDSDLVGQFDKIDGSPA